jgi:hypothetical protein
MRSRPTRLKLGAALSLSGRYGRFGTAAALGLRAWASSRPEVSVAVQDDESDPGLIRPALHRLRQSCDLLLGPYSTRLMREAGAFASEADVLIWNHGGAGDDVQLISPGRVVSVLTPASRYARPFLERLWSDWPPAPLALRAGRGRFAHQVIDGAGILASRLGIREVEVLSSVATSPMASRQIRPPGLWDLLCAGSFEEDVETVRSARAMTPPPRLICSVAAGVREFGRAVDHTEGLYGLAQWFPGGGSEPTLGPSETDYVSAYRGLAGEQPEYPAVQAAIAAELAVHCARLAGGSRPEAVWPVVSRLSATTLFGAFAIDPDSGLQTGHETTMVRWTAGGLYRA